ncbi:MAG TPA: hypothetical protein VD788_12605 [Candidatus Polarisedimenticolaceae bacterium]|nr:hypothetical protein [Candidatus Polarisedimenticolaceae bacterium]
MDRKYRQRGYMDGDRDDDRSRGKTAPRKQLTKEERIQQRSLRHAMDREAREVMRCHVCGRSVFDLGTIGRETACPHCNAALHCCRTCVHFDSAARWQCRVPIQQAVPDKNKANECSEYSPRLVLDATGRRSSGPAGGRAGDARSQFEDLFKS